MSTLEIIRTANANLRRSKVRTFLTTSAVFMGALTLMLTTGVGEGLKKYVEGQINAAGAKDALIFTVITENGGPVSNNNPKEYKAGEKVTTGDFTAIPTLGKEDLDKIRATEYIKSVVPLYSITTQYLGNGENKYQANVSQYIEGLNIPLRAGRLIDVNTDRHEIMIAPSFVSALGFKNEQDAIGKQIQVGFKDSMGEVFFEEAIVVGVQEKTLIQGNAMNVSLSLIEDAYKKMTAGLPDFQQEKYVAAVAKYDTSISDQQLEELKNSFKDDNLAAQTLDDQLGIIRSVIDGIITFLNIFAGIVLAAATFGIINTLLMAVQERTREIGLMKALGMSRNKIFALFSIEAVLIGFWGSIIALIAANIIGRLGSVYATQTLLKDFEGLILFSFPLTAMVPIILLIMLIAFLASALPARRASRLDPIEALRYE